VVCGRRVMAAGSWPQGRRVIAVRIFFTVIKGAPSARQADRHRPRLAKDARDVYGGRERAGQCSAVTARGGGDSRRRWRGSLAHFLLRGSASSRAAARRADAPPPPQHAPRRNAPWVMRSASWPGRSSRPGAPIAGRKVTATEPERRALSRSAPPASRAPQDPLTRKLGSGGRAAANPDLEGGKVR
jgi:hypothetical protein